MDVGATWKVAAESNVLMTEEEAKARLVLEIAYTEMKETKNSTPPGYDPQPVFTNLLQAHFFYFVAKRRKQAAPVFTQLLRSCCPAVAGMACGECCKSIYIDI